MDLPSIANSQGELPRDVFEVRPLSHIPNQFQENDEENKKHSLQPQDFFAPQQSQPMRIDVTLRRKFLATAANGEGFIRLLDHRIKDDYSAISSAQLHSFSFFKNHHHLA